MSDRDDELLVRILEEDRRRERERARTSEWLVRLLLWFPLLGCVAYGMIGSLLGPEDLRALLTALIR